jgi:hypothetical protein
MATDLYVIAVQVEEQSPRKTHSSLPPGCTGFIFQLNAASSKEAIDTALLFTRSWCVGKNLNSPELTAVDLTPCENN